MDISYLLLLQDLRNHVPAFWTTFFQQLSHFSVSYLFLVPLFIYWAVDKRRGLFTLASFHLSIALDMLIKLTACVYRPWVKDLRLVPVQKSWGYSFPSGHAAIATPVYGSLAAFFWRRKSMKWVAVLCILCILLTAFSRNFLGVHTPQDVGVGMAVGGFSLWVMGKIFADLEKHPERENYFLAGTIIAAVAALVYVTFKAYPIDYLDGKILVDPAKGIQDGYEYLGALIAFCAARYTERRWIGFKVTGWTLKGVVLCIIGLALMGLMMVCLPHPLKALCGAWWGRFWLAWALVWFGIALWPLVLKLACAKK